MANTIRLKRASGSDPGASDLVTGELAVRTDTAKLFTKKDDNSVVEVGVGISDIVDDTSPQLGGDLQSNGNDIDFADNDKAIFGTGGDLEIYHDGSNSTIDNSTGDLLIKTTGSGDDIFIQAVDNIFLQPQGGESGIEVVGNGSVNLYYDNSKKFETTANGADINSGSDISMDSSGNGQLRVVGNGYSGGIALDSSGLHLYHNSSSRAIIFGINESEAARFDTSGNFDIANDSGKIRLGASNDLQIYHDGSHSRIQDAGTGTLILQGSEINLNNSDSSEYGLRVIQDGAVELYHNGSKKLETTANGIEVTSSIFLGGKIDMPDNSSGSDGKILLGTGDDLELFHNGTQSEINSITGGLVIKDTGGFMRIRSDELKIQSESNENYIECDANGAVQLFHNNSVKFVTSSSGGTITGTLVADGFTGPLTGNVTGNASGSSGSCTGNAATATKLAATKTIAGVAFDGSANISLNNNAITNGAGYITSADGGNAATLDSIDSSQFLRSDTTDTASGVLTISGGLSFGADAKCAAGVSALSDGSTITVDFTSGIHHSVTLGGNRTFGNPSNDGSAVGQCGSIFITQDGTGGRTASFHSDYKFVGGTAPTLSTSANAVDRLDYIIKASGVIHCVVSLDIK
jgi:hypothetical protein